MNVKKKEMIEDRIVKTNGVDGGKTTFGRRCEKDRKGTEQSTYARGESKSS